MIIDKFHELIKTKPAMGDLSKLYSRRLCDIIITEPTLDIVSVCHASPGSPPKQPPSEK